MRRRDLQLHGQTNSQGTFLMANKADMAAFFKQWPNTYFSINIEVSKTEPLSVPLLVYYKKKVVADMRDAYFRAGERLTLEETDLKLREQSPITIKQNYNIKACKWETEILEIEQLDTQQLVFFVEHIKELAAQEFNVWVDDPTSLLD